MLKVSTVAKLLGMSLRQRIAESGARILRLQFVDPLLAAATEEAIQSHPPRDNLLILCRTDPVVSDSASNIETDGSGLGTDWAKSERLEGVQY